MNNNKEKINEFMQIMAKLDEINENYDNLIGRLKFLENKYLELNKYKSYIN